MSNNLRTVTAASICCLLLMGCGGGEGGPTVKIAPAKGIVTYKGSPLAGANVTFIPENGPLSMAVTELNGEFKLMSGAISGCAVGPAKVSVAVASPDDNAPQTATLRPEDIKTPEQSAEYAKQMAQMTQDYQKRSAQGKKSLIPERYRDPKTSGLTYTIDADASKNDFKIELND